MKVQTRPRGRGNDSIAKALTVFVPACSGEPAVATSAIPRSFGKPCDDCLQRVRKINWQASLRREGVATARVQRGECTNVSAEQAAGKDPGGVPSDVKHISTSS
eukprot:6489296-Amphidinium_carterae.1